MLRVKAIPGEPTCYHVESAELQCKNPECAQLYKTLPPMLVWFSKRQKEFLRFAGVWTKIDKILSGLKKPIMRPGDQCKKCGNVVDHRWHRVDISAYNLNGECGCEKFYYDYGPALRRGGAVCGEHRCSHIEAARDFALDLSLASHQKNQGHKITPYRMTSVQRL